MPLSPMKPRDGSPGEQARYEADLAAFRKDPAGWGVIPYDTPTLPSPPPEAVKSEPAAVSPPEPQGGAFSPFTDDELAEMSKRDLENHARDLPNGQSFEIDRRWKKEKIIEQIKVRYENLTVHEPG